MGGFRKSPETWLSNIWMFPQWKVPIVNICLQANKDLGTVLFLKDWQEKSNVFGHYWFRSLVHYFRSENTMALIEENICIYFSQTVHNIISLKIKISILNHFNLVNWAASIFLVSFSILSVKIWRFSSARPSFEKIKFNMSWSINFFAVSSSYSSSSPNLTTDWMHSGKFSKLALLFQSVVAFGGLDSRICSICCSISY